MDLQTAYSLFSKIGDVELFRNTGCTLYWRHPESRKPWMYYYADAIVYALLKNEDVVYIGHTYNRMPRNHFARCWGKNSTRLGGHRKTKDYDQVLTTKLKRSSEILARDVERCMILLAQPKYNKQYWKPSKFKMQ